MFDGKPKRMTDKLNRLARLWRCLPVTSLFLPLFFLCLSLATTVSGSSLSSSSPAAASSIVNSNTTLQCHVRPYVTWASKKPIVGPDGNEVTCEGQVVVGICWGRCDSSEIGDFKMPFKVSHHPVCTYTGRIKRTVTLSQCAGYPDPTIKVFDAAGCACKQCNSDFTSCENL